MGSQVLHQSLHLPQWDDSMIGVFISGEKKSKSFFGFYLDRTVPHEEEQVLQT